MTTHPTPPNTELAACPFCGCEDIRYHEIRNCMTCNECDAESGYASGKAHAIERWNTRHLATLREDGGETFQSRVKPWMDACFGPEISADKIERNHRFLEEALELVQSNGCTQSEAHQLVDYVYGRDVGEINQEVGGVMVTLAALCLANGIDMHQGGETELARIWTKVEKIRAKQAAKPKHSPLPEAALKNPSDAGGGE